MKYSERHRQRTMLKDLVFRWLGRYMKERRKTLSKSDHSDVRLLVSHGLKSHANPFSSKGSIISLFPRCLIPIVNCPNIQCYLFPGPFGLFVHAKERPSPEILFWVRNNHPYKFIALSSPGLIATKSLGFLWNPSYISSVITWWILSPLFNGFDWTYSLVTSHEVRS